MGRLLRIIILVALGAVGGWTGREYAGTGGLEGLLAQVTHGSFAPPPPSTGDAIKIASWNIQTLGQEKMSRPELVARLVQSIRQFDVIAVQEIRSAQQDVMPRLVAALNASGGTFDFVIGPRLGRTDSKEQYAFIYNTARIEIDHSRTFTVADPGDRLHREPLAALFRVRGPEPREAFTFMLVNVHTDPDEVPAELAALADVYRAVANAGSGEDDIIILGDFNAAPEHLAQLRYLPDVSWVISGTPTNVRRNNELDNILFPRTATSEFTGRGGVLDLESQMQITRDECLELSDHLPIWAEFSVFEGGRTGYVAGAPRQTH